MEPAGPVPKGRELVVEWDRENPQWAYGQDTRRFWRDYYNRARQSVLLPPYVWRD